MQFEITKETKGFSLIFRMLKQLLQKQVHYIRHALVKAGKRYMEETGWVPGETILNLSPGEGYERYPDITATFLDLGMLAEIQMEGYEQQEYNCFSIVPRVWIHDRQGNLAYEWSSEHEKKVPTIIQLDPRMHKWEASEDQRVDSILPRYIELNEELSYFPFVNVIKFGLFEV
jgi:hypothetical protein